MTEVECFDKSWTDTLEQATPENIDDVNGVNEFIKKNNTNKYYLKKINDPNWKEKEKEINKLNYAKRKAKLLEAQLINPIVKEKKKITKEEKRAYNNTYISKKKNVMILCECGNEYSFIQKTQHCNTKKHLDSIKEKQSNIIKELYCQESQIIDWNNEEQVHLYNCQFGDYDQQIRSFPN